MVRVHMGRRVGEEQGSRLAVAWLPEAALAAIGRCAPSSEHTACVVCLDAQVAISLQPCGPTCLCGGCALRLKRAARGGALPPCPVCREPALGCHRVFVG